MKNNSEKISYLIEKENTVEAKNQIKAGKHILFENTQNKGTRFLFLGNSTALHGVKTDIGWYNDWGMAASKRENDYVHILEKRILSKISDASFCICNVAEWERSYIEGEKSFCYYENARNFNADIIVARFSENCPIENFDEKIFEEQYTSFVDYFNPSQKASVILSTGFWKHPADEIIKNVADKYKCPCVYLSDLEENEEMKASGLFLHSGVANHPGDKGMQEIADRIWKELSLKLN